VWESYFSVAYQTHTKNERERLQSRIEAAVSLVYGVAAEVEVKDFQQFENLKCKLA
jgi:hypothetical protein